MWSCDQSFVTLALLRKQLSQPYFYKDLTRKTYFFEGCSWFKLSNLGLALGMVLKFYTSVSKECLFIFFSCYLAVPRSTLGHSQGDSLTNPMLITSFVHVRPECHQEPRNEVGSLSLAKRLAWFELRTFRF